MKLSQFRGRIAPMMSVALITSVMFACSDASSPRRETESGAKGRPETPASFAETVLPAVTECATPGAGWIFCDDFETDRTARYFEYNNGGGKFVRAAATGLNGSVGMRGTYTAGSTSQAGLSLAFGRTPSSYFRPVDAGTANYREVYWRFFVRREAGWVGNGPAKLTRATAFAKSDWSQAMIAHGWTSDSDDNYLMIDPARGTDAAGNLVTVGYNDFSHLQWLGGARSAAAEEAQAAAGVWKCYEYHAKLNDAGQSNGVFEFSVDGQVSASRTGMNWVGAYNAYGINAIMLEQYQNNGAPAANQRTMDNFVVSTQPIGCGTSAPPPVVTPIPVATVSVSLAPTSVEPGQSAQASATTRDSSGNVLTGRAIAWSSSNTSVATVSAAGVVTAVGAGTAAITATSEGQSASASIAVASRIVGLVAAYGFNEPSGATTSDASGNSNNGTLGSGVTRTTAGRFGSALAFNGGGMVTVPNAASLSLSTAMTLEAWVNPQVINNNWRDVVYKGNDNYFLMASSTNASKASGGGIIAGVSGTSQAYSSAKLAVGTWVHMAVTYDRVNVRFYLNGVQVSSVARTGLIKTSTNPLTIGGDAIYGQFFKGTIDEVRVYNRALSASEIKTDMNSAVSGSTVGQPVVPPARARDSIAPVLNIASPTSGSSYTTTSGTISLSGTSSDNVGVSQVTWSNSRGGSGTASGTTNWSVSGVALQSGSNDLTITARDTANNAAVKTLTVTYNLPVAPVVATTLGIVTQPSSSAESGVVFVRQPVIQLRDASANPVSQSGVPITASLASGAGTLGGTVTATTNSSGVATFSNLSITGVDGDRTLRFSSGTLTAATSSAITLMYPPAAPAQSAGCPNEPAGSSTLNEMPWDQIPTRTTAVAGWLDDGDAGSRLSVVNDPTSPFASANHNVVAGLFPGGMTGGVGPFYVYKPFASGEQFKNLYMCVYMKHSSNFDNVSGGNAGTKLFWPAGDQVQGALTYVTFDGPNMNLGVNQQGAEEREMYQNVGTAGAGSLLSKRGQWVRYEFLLNGNTNNSTADGALTIWVDGVMTHKYTNVRWQMATARKWLSMAWNPTYGGGTNPVPSNQYEYIDHIHMSGKP